MALDLACDESGYDGDLLVPASTEVFAHATVRLDAGSAADCVHELRRRIRSPAVEYKAVHLLRAAHRATLLWFLRPGGLLPGHAGVYLVDKACLVVRRLRAASGGALGELRFTAARVDPRVQIADFLAGIVTRRVAVDALHGRPDRELEELTGPLVDPASIWAVPYWPTAPSMP